MNQISEPNPALRKVLTTWALYRYGAQKSKKFGWRRRAARAAASARRANITALVSSRAIRSGASVGARAPASVCFREQI